MSATDPRHGWHDPDTATYVQFASSYMGESTFTFTHGVAEAHEKHRWTLVIGNESPESLVTPEIRSYLFNAMPANAREVWERFCAACREHFAEWCAARGLTAVDS